MKRLMIKQIVMTKNNVFGTIVMALLMLMGTTGAWAQTDYSGVYYIANKIWNGSNTSSPYYYYSSSTPEYNWYLVPAADPHQSHYSDAYFNAQYVNTNSGGKDYTGDNYGDPGKPFLTTYRTNRDNNSIWILKKSGDYYYIIHGLTGKYVKYEPPYKDFAARKTMHLETVDTETPGNAFQFSITTNTSDGITGLNIAPRNNSGNYFNPAGDNWERYYGTNDGNKKPFSQGMVGLYTGDLNKGGSWPRETATFAAPTITCTTGVVTVTDNNSLPAGYTVRYTIDGTAPTASSEELPVGGYKVEDPCTFKAVLVRYGLVLTAVASQDVEPAVYRPTITYNSTTGEVTITPHSGSKMYYTTTGVDPTTDGTSYTEAVTFTITNEMTSIKAIAVDNENSSLVSAIATLPLCTYKYKVINKSNKVATDYSFKQPAGITLSGYTSIPAAIRSEYLNNETVTFYSFEGDETIDSEISPSTISGNDPIHVTPAENANIYVTYTTTRLGEKFLPLTNVSPFNIKDGDGKCRYDDGGTLKTDADATEYKAAEEEKEYLWYFIGSDPYDVKIQNVNTSTDYINYTSPTLSLGVAQSFILKSSANHTALTKTVYEDITFRNTSGEEVTLRVNTVVLPISYWLMDKQGKVIKSNIEYEGSFGLPSAWQSPLVSLYKYYKDYDSKVGDIYTFKEDDRITRVDQLGDKTVIYVTYDVNTSLIDLDGRNLLNDPEKVEGTTYMLQFQTPNTDAYKFFQEDGKDGVMTEKRRAVYPYSNGDATLYVYGSERWEEQLASGASTRTRWLWYLEPASSVLDPYHVRVSSYQTQTSYKVSDSETRNFHSYLWTYKPTGYSEVVTGVTNNNPLAHGGSASDPAVTALPEGSEYMLLGTSTSDLKLVTFDEITGGADNGTYGTRQTVHSLEQYWKNNPTVQKNLTTKVTTVGRNVTLEDQQSDLTALGWHSYKAWANSAPWVHNDDAAAGKTPTTSKKFLEEEHVFQTIEMGESFQLIPTELKTMLILLDQHGWEIVRLPLPSGPSDPKRKDIYANIHKYSSPMVERYHFWKTGSKVPGYHKFRVSNYATVSDVDPTEYTADELGRADITNPLTPPNLPNYETQALVGGKERDWYVTYDVKPEYASTYAGAATEGATSAAPFLVKQGGVYAKIDGTSLVSAAAPASIESVPENMQWYLRPNFNIDREMGYIYEGEPNAQEDAMSQTDTELAYFNGETPTWSNGFDPYNVQIQSVSNTARYFTANTTGSAVSSAWSGSSSSITLENLSVKQSGIVGHDQAKMNITNATFMVVCDDNNNMRLMPRFDNTKVMQSFTALVDTAKATSPARPANDKGEGIHSLYLTPVPKVVSNSSEVKAMGGRYILADNFTASGSIGTRQSPFKGIIDGKIDKSFSVSAPFIAFAEDAIIRNVIIESASISGDTVGAIVNQAKGNTRIYNCGVNGGTVSGSMAGSIVGHLDGSSRVINCYSYANVSGSSYAAGIVGYNAFASTQLNLRTMVMNCMFYGEISGSGISPVYGGLNIDNLHGGLNTFNYYNYDKLRNTTISSYNCALGVEDLFLTRFETYRQLLNSNKKLAAFYATGDAANANQMAKWILETADRSIANPKLYPVLQERVHGRKAPSIINYDVANAPDSTSVGRNHGGKLGKILQVTINQSSSAPTGATITTDYLELQRTDKDFDRYNYNYDKVQLPYYNDVGTKNYSGGKVVTGWKITSLSGGTAGTYTASDSWGGYNFADRKCTNKDRYGTGGSNRVFSQGAYFDVPYGVTAIEIEPYWGNAAYVADEYLDVIYNTSYAREEENTLGKQFATQTISLDGSNYTVYTTIGDAAGSFSTGSNVYDNAVVLVGNVHLEGNPPSSTKPFTVMSADFNSDNEPDYSFIFGHNDRQVISPVRFDFINMPGIAMAQKPNGAGTFRNVSIFKPKGWFETTNTCITRFVQFEYDNGGKSAAPVILQGGLIDQFVSTKTGTPKVTQYIHIGGNTWFKDFGNGTHSDGKGATKHIPISVTGGDFDGLYLSGTYRPDAAVNDDDHAECYISGGHFVEVAGAAQQQIKGNVQWQIYDADIDNFYGGGINFNKPITGTIITDIFNSHVGTFCGGPKFGNMSPEKTVTTNATGCTFDKFFGAGYGGISYNRVRTKDVQNATSSSFNSWKTDYTNNRGKYISANSGVATDFDYEFFVWSTGVVGARFYVKYASLSTAQTNDVSSTLTRCIVNKDFYGGGSLGNVIGTATSVLIGCTVEGNVFGGGYSASKPKVPIRATTVFDNLPDIDMNAGVFDMGKPSETEDFTLIAGTLTNNTSAINEGTTPKTIVTNVDMTALGQVTNTDLTIKGNTIVRGQIFDESGEVSETTGGVFGGGDMSAVHANTKVDVQGTESESGILNIFGGGNTADVVGDATVSVTGGKIGDIYGGGKGSTTIVGGDVKVHIGKSFNEDGSVAFSGTPSITGSVYGGSALGSVNTTEGKKTGVNIYAGTVNGSVYGGGLGQLHEDAVPASGTPGDPEYVPAKDAVPAIVAENRGNTTVNMEGGWVKTAVYGGSNINGVLTKNDTVTITGGTVGTSWTTPVPSPLPNVVFGGGKGEPTLVNGHVTVNIGTLTTGPTYTGTANIYGNVYGGSALGNTNASKSGSDPMVFDATKKTNVYLYGGTIYGNVFGGGLGQKNGEYGATSNIVSYVGGDVNVLLDGAVLSKDEGTGQIFGCNNLNGTPKGHVKVWVKRTKNIVEANNKKYQSEATLEQRTTYDVNAVYGGGNKADYNPTDANIVLPDKAAADYNEKLEKLNNAFAEVLIEGCDTTSIQYVYGGGNAAAVPATQITIESAYIIDQIFGGGNGAGAGNPGADVGIIDKAAYEADASNPKTAGTYGTGVALTKLKGGQVHVLYGGSNTLGNVRGGTELDRTETSSCAMKIGEIYGAGQVAPMDGDVNIVLECMPEDFVKQVFGGAKNATVNGNVSLTVTSGKFGRVFGGNNEGGSINGSITVNVYEDGCQPLIIGELYGGGFNAPYSIYGCTEGTSWTANTEGSAYAGRNPAERADIEVNVFSCTSVGKVFGGGFGKTAKVIGNTHVWVNTMQGIVNGAKKTYATGPDVYIGKIGQVFGGGNAAPLVGDVTIDIGTATVNESYSGEETEKIGIRMESGTYLSPSADRDTTINVGIYGGGFSADVEGDVTMNIGTVSQNQGINIGGDIFGGGYGETTTVKGNVEVNIGKDNAGTPVGYATITGDVYGGSAKGKVNATKGGTEESPTYSATTDKATTVNLYGGTIKDTDPGTGKGNLYGGGLGEATHAADVYGPVTVNVKDGNVYNVFGCNNVLGTPKSTVAVNIDGGAISQSVYGGGNQAIMDGSPVVTVTGGTIGTVDLGSAVYGNVFGGGLGSDGTGALTNLEKVKAGLVKGNTEINISGGSILHNIYGGGAYGSVGTYTYNETTGAIESYTSGGTATITITGGTIGTNGHNNGMVFGSSRGDIDAPKAIHDNLAWVFDTDVTIGTNGSETGPTINGSLYGGGENGHVYNDAKVTMYSGTVGNMEKYYSYRGNVYGGGCGTDLYYSGEIPEGHTKHDGEGDKYNPKAGIVNRNATVIINGGNIANNVYGAGSMGKVDGNTSVTINTTGAIGVDGNHDDGNVYGAARGELNLTGKIPAGDTPEDYSYVTNSSVTISKGTVKGCVFGGGKAGIVKGNVAVTVSGGVVKNDVYGGGALANTNTDNWNTAGSAIEYVEVDNATLTPTYSIKEIPEGQSVEGYYTYNTGTSSYEAATGTAVKGTTYYQHVADASVTGYYTRSGTDPNYVYTPASGSAAGGTKYYKKKVVGGWAETHPHTTTVVLTGGIIGNAYGGGLGSSTVAANVYGDVKVTVNKLAEMTSTGGTGIAFTRENTNVTFGGKEYIIPVTGRVFGCNNINGTPTGNVEVEVYATRQIEKNGADNYTLYPISGEGSEHSPNSHNKYYEVQAVYGGGNLSDYLPAAGSATSVYIGECDVTSIEKVYGGGNSAVVPSSEVVINGSFDIGTAFGGGNGGDLVQKDGVWYENDGAIVIGQALIRPKGGKVGEIFGGSDAKGFCGNPIIDKTEHNNGCPLVVTRMYGAGKESDVDKVDIIISGCTAGNTEIEYVFGGSYNAHIAGNVNLTITAGVFKNVFGGNDRTGSIGGNITVNIEETEDCVKPLIIQNLFGGGNEAPYPGTKRDGTEYVDPGKITVNVKSATRIDNIFGGSFKADVNGDTEVNINMTKGFWAGKTYKEELIPDSVGVIGTVYGGGNQGVVRGNSTVNIATESTVDFITEPKSLGTKGIGEQTLETPGVAYIQNLDGTFKTKVLGARITGDVFGGGSEANVNGNATVNICTANYAGVAGFQGVSINESVYGGGSSADVLGNTSVTMGGGYVYDGVYGGGLHGSVGTVSSRTPVAGHPSHSGCVGGKPNFAANTGKCTVVVSGGQVGPVEAATEGMTKTGGPVDVGFVFGAGRGDVEDPTSVLDADYHTYVNETEVIIRNAYAAGYEDGAADSLNHIVSSPIIMASVYGGGENGRVRSNTLVKIYGGQIGCGKGKTDAGKPVAYTEDQWTAAMSAVTSGNVTAIETAAAAMPECSHYPYKSPYVPFDPYYDDPKYATTHYPTASTDDPSDGKTYYGCVFGGGSGYYPYEKSDGTGYEWLRSAGRVDGNTRVLISGGHILTNVYGGNEYTDIDGDSCVVIMTGGTLGVPRTLSQIAAHPVTCYLFGAGKGDQRVHFNQWTNVKNVRVGVGGTAMIFGSVFGGGEDGHVLGNAKVDVWGGTIGTWGTSYVDGNVFGGGRGFSGEALTAGVISGNVTMNVSGGTMLGSIYGGGRLGAVGTYLVTPEDERYGTMIPDGKEQVIGGEDITDGGKTHGHITINISGGTIGNNYEFKYYATASDPTASVLPNTDITNDTGRGYWMLNHTKGGNVYAGAMGRREKLGSTTEPITVIDWHKLGSVKSTKLTISGASTWIKGNVYGGGEFGAVTGYHTVADKQYGTEVLVQGGTIGTVIGDNINATTFNTGVGSGDTRYSFGSIYGGGYGTEADVIASVTPAIPADPYTTNVEKFGAYVNSNTYVSVSGDDTKVRGSVYGGGELAAVRGNSNVNVSNGEIGVGEVKSNDYVLFGSWRMGNVFGGGKGSTNAVYSGIVLGNANINVTGGSIYHNVYGGGALGSVGTFEFSTEENKASYGVPYANMPVNWTEGTGTASVTITGGQIGINGWDNGMVNGSGRGDISDSKPAGLDPYDNLAWVNNSVVTVGTAGQGAVFAAPQPQIKGTVYGGGENGHNRGDAEVTVHSGTIGTYASSAWENGNVFGAGCGTDTYPTPAGKSSSYKYFNPMGGRVQGTATLTIDGGHVLRSVYGGGSMASVDGATTVTVSGGRIGVNGDGNGSVYGGPKGSLLTDPTDSHAIAHVAASTVNIDYATTPASDDGSTTQLVTGSVYGGGEAGVVYNNVVVNMDGGLVLQNVYGGGALADTNTKNWDASANSGVGGWAAGKTSASATTTVNLMGGRIMHDAYGGALGRFANTSPAVTEIAPNIYGDILVELNNNKSGAEADGEKKGCIVDRVFGCNDMVGTPKGHVKVHVYGTQNAGTANMGAKVGPVYSPSPKQGTSEGYIDYLNRLITMAKPGGSVLTGIDPSVISAAETYISDKVEGSLTDEQKTAITTHANNVIAELEKTHGYDVTAVYGGGDLAPYEPVSSAEQNEVVIEGCDVTSIKQVYGGGNAASAPGTNVLVKSVFIIDELFGGGNGHDNYTKNDKWYGNPGANIGYRLMSHYDTGGSHGTGIDETHKYEAITNTDPSAETKEARIANYSYGTGIASTTVNGGHIHNVYGGSNEKGNIRGQILLDVEQHGTCTLITDLTYGGSKSSETDAQIIVEQGCVENAGELFGGSYKADIYSDIHIKITNGHYTKVFGGNNRAGTIHGKITIDVEENGCTPIIIDELYAGGNLAPYSVYGFKTTTQNAKDADGNDLHEEDDPSKPIIQQRIPYRADDAGALATPYRDPQINIISASHIGYIFGGGYGAGATMIGSPHINVNMTKGKINKTYKDYKPEYATTYPTTDGDGNRLIPVGTINYIYGGGNLSSVEGNTSVEIGTGTHHNDTGELETIDPARKEATINVDVFGGGKGRAEETGTDAFTCAKGMVGVVDEGNIAARGNTSVVIGNALIKGSVYGGGQIGRVENNTSVTIGVENNTTDTLTINGSVYGAGQGAETHGYAGLTRGNSTIVVQGKSKVLGSVYGGGENASVGRYNVVDGIPVSLISGGTCTVTVRDSAEIGPDNMIMTKVGGPDNTGHVFGAGKGVLPSVYTYSDNAHKPWHIDDAGTKVYSANEEAYLTHIESLGLASSTLVTISEDAFVKADVFGGAEQGFVQSDTHVIIEGNCQIGNGYVQMDDDGTYLGTKGGVNRRYTPTEWADGRLYPTGALATLVGDNYQHSLPECASWTYESPYEPHDTYADSYGYDSKGGAVTATNGRTFFGNVFGGGSGYFPYAPGKWHWKSGNVGGDALVEIKGGHVLTNVYGANELTNVQGKSTVTMTGGTIGVPRTVGQIINHPVTCYLFGGGAGDPRVLFNKQTNVQDAEVSVTGGWIYGSVFGGGEDGHVMRNVDITIGGTAKIGTWGTTYVDGNVFGGGRGFSADAYTAGNVAGSVTMTISGGEILGSVYGGGRLGSVGYGLYDSGADGYGEMREDHKYDNGTDDDISEGHFFDKGRGHVNITISGGIIGNTNEFIVPNATNIAAADIDETDITKWKAEGEVGSEWTKWKKYHNVPLTVYDTTNGRVTHTKGGNIFAGGMGRYVQLDGSTPISAVDWWKLGNVKSTTLNISGTPWIMGNVYGGGELGAVRPYKDSPSSPTVVQGGTTSITITGGTIGTEVTGATPVQTTIPTTDSRSAVQYTFGSVFGGGMGMEEHDAGHRHGGEVSDSTIVTMSGAETKVRASVYGGGEVAVVGGNAHVTINGGEIGRNEVKPLTDPDAGYVLFGGATMGNVYGAGKGILGHTEAGGVKGNTFVTISGGNVYHMVYGGGALGSVGTFKLSKKEGGVYVPSFIPVVGVPYDWTEGTGTATVTITGGTIGISGRDNGLVFGSSRGNLTKPVADPESDNKLVDPYDKVAWVNNSVVNIGTEGSGTTLNTPHIKCSVYGGGENGHNDESATVNVYSGTIGITDTEDPWYDFGTNEIVRAKAQTHRGNVYGAGSGSDTYKENGKDVYNKKSGMVGGNTFVNIKGGHVGRCVYGGGAMAMVGTIANVADTATVAKHADIIHPGESNEEVYGFALSWPYELVFADGTGKATVNVTGGHIGTRQLDGGDVYGSSRGEADNRYVMAHHAYVKETEVNITYPSTAEMTSESAIQEDFSTQCITGSVHGSGENGYVYGDTHVTLNKGLIGHSLYGGGKGKGTYTMKIPILAGAKAGEKIDRNIYGLLAGKVLGNTYVTMIDGHVGRNVYGGGNMGSVGKGNYAGGSDDYYPTGYGETLNKDGAAPADKKLWDSSANANSAAFLSSGKTFVNVIGGTVGYIDAADPSKSMKNNLPYGNVIGGSAGEPAPNIVEMPRYQYSPAFFSGYVNETDVTIGGYQCKTAYSTYKLGDRITVSKFKSDVAAGDTAKWTSVGPTIKASVYGGGQDGHVRRWTHVTINNGVIGIPYDATGIALLKTSDFDDPQWLYRGNVYGAGSGITKYAYDFNGNGKTHDESGESEEVTYHEQPTKEEDYSTSAGSVAHFTTVDVLGGTIYRNVLGGGSLASVGPPKIDQPDYAARKTATATLWGQQTLNLVNIGGAKNGDGSFVKVKIGEPKGVAAGYGGHVFGGSRGDESLGSDFGSSIWTKVTIKNGAIIHGDVFGGGNAGQVMKDTEVKIGE